MSNTEIVQSCDIERLFKRCFLSRYNTVLVGGAVEPLYLPCQHSVPDKAYQSLLSARAIDISVNVIFYREDFVASSLHEVAHWCIAGKQRRSQLDFGYWYEADGRTAEQQQAFYNVEVKPQALELLFSIVAGLAFRVSVDNLDGTPAPDSAGKTELFARQVAAQAQAYIADGIPERAEQFIHALSDKYGTSVDVKSLDSAVKTYEQSFNDLRDAS